MKRFATIIYLGISALCAFAQANVQAKIDPMEILIGEQAQVTISVQAQENDKVEFPVLKSRQMLVPGVEVIDSHTGLTDPLNPSNRLMTITLTSFDGKVYHLPPFKVKVNGKEFTTADLALKVVEILIRALKSLSVVQCIRNIF